MAARFSLLLVGCLLSVSPVSVALNPSEEPKDTPTISPATTGVPNPATTTATLNRTSTPNGIITTTGSPPNVSVDTSTVSGSTAGSVSTATPGPATEAGETIATSTPPTAPSSPPTTVPTTQSPTTTGIFNTTSNPPSTQSPATSNTVNATSVSPSHQPTEVPHTANTTSWVSTTNAALNDTQESGRRLDDSEKTLTVVFSVVLGVLVLGLVMYQITRCHQRRVQYSHQPLTENTADLFIADEDTLVISGGLYDGHVSEPTTTQQDFDPDPSQSTQFRLEFLNDDR